MSANPWKTIKRKVVYEDKYGYKLREDEVRTPSGSKGKYTVFEGSGYVVIVAINSHNQVFLVRQWRYTIEEESLELPAGTIDKNESPLKTAKRELKEEVGVTSNEWIDLGWHWLGNGVMNIKGHVFLALNIKVYDSNSLEDDEKLKVEKIDFNDAIRRVYRGDFRDLRTQIGLLLAKNYLLRKTIPEEMK